MYVKPSISIRDSNLFNPKNTQRGNQFFDWKWEQSPVRNEIPLIVFTDKHLHEVENSLAKVKVAWIMEPPSIDPIPYRYIQEHYHLFDAVFTYHTDLFNLGSDVIKFYEHGSSWIQPIYRAVYQKSKLISAVFSNKRSTQGHRLRHDIARKYRDVIDLYGHGYKPVKPKVIAMKDYMYSMAVENTVLDIYFTEKVMDCFNTGSIPIYYGTRGIAKYFNTDGILFFSTMDELDKILGSISKEDYESRMDAIQENFKKADSHLSLEHSVWVYGLKELYARSLI